MPRGEGIKSLNSLFEKYKKTLKAPQGSIVTAFCEVAEDLYGWNLNKKQIEYNVSTRTIHLKVSGVMKTEVKLKKAEILNHLKARLGEQNAPKQIL